MSALLSLPPPETEYGGSESYWVALLSEAGEIPIGRQPLADAITFRFPQGLLPGSLAFVALYQVPSGGTPLQLVEVSGGEVLGMPPGSEVVVYMTKAKKRKYNGRARRSNDS